MWPLYFLLSKIFNVEEAEAKLNGSVADNVNARECHLIGPSSSGRKCQDDVLCCSLFIEVRELWLCLSFFKG